jgi:hypothetical protein
MTEKMKLMLGAALLLFAGLACSVLYEFNCAAKGGAWVEGYWDDDFFVAAHCDESDYSPQANASGADNNTGTNDKDTQPNTETAADLPAASQHAPLEMADPAECNAAASLNVNVGQPEIKDTSNETRCKYTNTYTNTGDQQIWVFVHKREKGAYTEVEEIWKNYYSLEPGEILEISYDTHQDKESGNSWIEVVIGVAPIYTTDACKNTFKDDTAPRAQIGFPIEVPCE